jgi:hypothetical protein
MTHASVLVRSSSPSEKSQDRHSDSTIPYNKYNANKIHWDDFEGALLASREGSLIS